MQDNQGEILSRIFVSEYGSPHPPAVGTPSPILSNSNCLEGKQEEGKHKIEAGGGEKNA